MMKKNTTKNKYENKQKDHKHDNEKKTGAKLIKYKSNTDKLTLSISRFLIHTKYASETNNHT